MVNDARLIKEAKRVLRIESEAVKALASSINGDFVKAVNLLYSCKGRVIVTGMGKAGIIGRKAASLHLPLRELRRYSCIRLKACTATLGR